MKQTKAQLEAQKAHILSLLNDGMRPHEIHIAYGYNEASMYKWFEDLCKANTQRVKTIEQETIRLRRCGLSYDMIANELNIPKGTVAYYCRKSNLRDAGCGLQLTGEEFANKYVDAEQYEYVGGYTNCAGRVDLRCNRCGNVNSFGCGTVKKHKRYGGTLQCPDCIALEKKRKADALARQRDVEAQRRETEWEEAKRKRDAERKANHESRKRIVVCDVCGKTFLTYRQNVKRCSPECTRKFNNRKCTLRNEHRIPKDKMIDKDITLRSLYQRDGGFCHICGMFCDITLDSNDNYYPSIDHVVPVAKGGAHSWDNVRLAHRRCNSSKGASI